VGKTMTQLLMGGQMPVKGYLITFGYMLSRASQREIFRLTSDSHRAIDGLG
jgi:hypothetical protein